MKRLLFLCWTFCLLFPVIVFANTYPDYSGYVNDFAHVLTPAYATALQEKLKKFDTLTTNQIAVVTVDSTQPDTIEGYSIHLADKWKVGQKGKDNGIIMLFAMKDRQMRIEVGRGLEGDLTDVQAKHIQDTFLVPAFKQGRYEQGISDGVNVVIATVTHGKIDPQSLGSVTGPPQRAVQGADTITGIAIIVIILIILVSIAWSPKTKLGGRGTWGMTTFWGDDNNTGNGESGGFGGGTFSGGGASDKW